MDKLTGSFSVMSIADLIQWVRSAHKSGQLKIASAAPRELQVLFLDGRIIYSSTDCARETFGSYLLHLGLCHPEDIDWARRQEQATGVKMGSLLVSGGRLAETVALTTLTQKTIEDLCDVFLWKDGHFDFSPTSIQLKQFLAIDLDPIRVVTEGLRRAELWVRLSTALHPTIVFESSRRPFPDDTKWDDVVIARKVLEKVDGVRNVDDIVEAVPFSRFKTLTALSELREQKLIQRGDETELGFRESRIQKMIQEAEQAKEEERWGQAVQILEGLTAAYPRRQELTQMLLETLEGFRESVYRHNFVLEDVPVMTIGPEAMRRLDLDYQAGVLLSRIDGHTSVGGLLRIMSVSEVEGLRILKRLLDAKLIDFPSRVYRSARRGPPSLKKS